MKNIVIAAFAMFLAIGCSAQKTATTTDERRPQQGEKRERPSIEEIFKMDANKDGMLSQSEVKGPLQRDFSKIDSDSDGFISKSELENAPKPPRGEVPPQNKK